MAGVHRINDSDKNNNNREKEVFPLILSIAASHFKSRFSQICQEKKMEKLAEPLHLLPTRTAGCIVIIF